MNLHRPFIYTLSIGFVLLICLSSLQHNEAKPFHTRLEKKFLDKITRSPIDSDEYFLGSVRCKGCHGFDTLHIASIDANGVDINLYDDWQTSMMANAAKDPLWRAKVSHEILVNPAHSQELQTQCTACHAPLGHFTAIFKGAESYTIDDLLNDTLGLDGVSCGGCHEIGAQNLGTVFSGNIPYDTTKKEFGPFLNPLAGPMELYVGLTPTFSEHMSTSQVCSSCHTLLSNSLDENGNYTGNVFIEQATYHEWLNSALAQDNITCQHCHMPQVMDSVVIANNILALGPRSPFNQHQFVGGNAFMVSLMKQNKAALGIDAPDVNFDSTLAETYRMLQQKTVSLSLTLDSIISDSLFLRLQITNKAGHKFPSGYPSRRAVAQLIVTAANGDTVFQSGTFDSDFEVKNVDSVYEPHYNVIKNNGESQIYEMVMGDVNGHLTTLLSRGDHALKDNRIPPEGFVSTHYDYDTVKVVGDALSDADFNKTFSGIEGTGADIIHYHVPLNGALGILQVSAAMYYQAVPPRWVKDMFDYSSDAIDTFKNMYASSDRSPVLLSSTQLMTPVISSVSDQHLHESLSILNTLSRDGKIVIVNKEGLQINEVQVFNVQGEFLSTTTIHQRETYITLLLPANHGVYLVNVKTSEGDKVFKVTLL